jgi:hypothetical protein
MRFTRVGLSWRGRKTRLLGRDDQDARQYAMIVFPRAPVVFSSSSSRTDSMSSGSGFISQAAISVSDAPWKQSSQTPKPAPDRTGGPKTRQVIGRDSYSSQVPVSGSSAGQGSSLAKSSNRFSTSSPSSNTPLAGSPGNSCASLATASRARSPTPRARSGARVLRSARPRRSREASS